MARYEHLKIYQVNYQLTCEVFKLTKRFSREHKYTFGERLRNCALDLTMDIYQINNTQNKLIPLNNYLENLARFNTLIRLAKDMLLISIDQLSVVMEKSIEVGKMAEGWKDYCLKAVKKTGPECKTTTLQSA